MEPWYTDGRATLYVGHVLDVLAALEPGTVQTCITSPPYWGLRAYGTDPQVWGGGTACSHSLEETPPGKVLTGGNGTASAKQVSNAGSQYGNAWVEEYRPPKGGTSAHASTLNGAQTSARYKATIEENYQPAGFRSATCTRCGAWRGELGSEPTPELFVANLVTVFRAVWRVLRDDGTLWLNLGDSYASTAPGTRNAPQPKGSATEAGQWANWRPETPAGLKPKDLVGIPWRVAFALQADGWYLRSDIVWSKPNPMPESVTDRPTKAHEYLFLLSKRADYYYDGEAIKEPQTDPFAKYPRPRTNGKYDDEGLGNRSGAGRIVEGGRNRRSVWTIPTESYEGAHFATFPRKLVEPAVLAGTSARGQCPACGAPWRRVVEREFVPQPDVRTPERLAKASVKGMAPENGWSATPRGTTTGTTTGWEPGCQCHAGDPIPQVCLDPFAGSGTTLAVARFHQRRAIGIELNPAYAALVERRLAQGVLL